MLQNNKLVKQYRIAHGKGRPGAKVRLGDNRTPTGVYRALRFKSNSKFHFFIQLNYPNPLDAWRGYQNQLISAEEFKQIILAYEQNDLPPQHTRLGGHIGIHGIGPTTVEKRRLHGALNWTEGCIAVTNQEIDELRQYITRGARVTIRE